MNKYIKFVIAALFVVFGIYLFTTRQYGWGSVMILLSGIPILLYFKNEYILLAFWQLRKQNIPKAKAWLGKITNPESQLVRKQMGYYHYMIGMTDAQDNIKSAEKNMRKALDYGLTYKHDRAMANLTLAGGAMARGRKKEAELLLKESKNLDTEGMLADQIKLFQEQMKRMNVGSNMQNPHMRRRGKFF